MADIIENSGGLQYKLVDIKNGIAHGNDEGTSEIDRQCYEEVSKLLYEPPIQILFEVVNYSMRGRRGAGMQNVTFFSNL